MSAVEARSPGHLGRTIAGWVAVAASTALAGMWAFWGSIENFHEGWYYRELWRNLALMSVQYLPWMFLPMLAGLLALWRPAMGAAVHVLLAGGAFRLFGFRSAGATLLATPLLVLAALYCYGRPVPVRWARRVLVGVPLAIALVAGVRPGWRVLTRPAAVDTSMRRIQGNGVDLLWAPAGPGWDEWGFSWFEARRRCEHLDPSGARLMAAPQRVWRLPTVDEAVRTMIWRGQNAGGTWNPVSARASYRSLPDKEAPLWHPYSRVIYWWTADEASPERAYRVTYNGQVHAMVKKWRPAYMACRCVRNF